MIVTVYRVKSPTQLDAIATIRSGPNGPQVHGDASVLDDLTVVQPGNPAKRLTQADGDAWIAALPYNIAGIYVHADLTEGDDPYAKGGTS